MQKNILSFKKILKIKLPFFFFLSLIILFNMSQISLNDTKKDLNIKNCKTISYIKNQKLNPENFKTFDLKLDIPDQRKWKKILFENQISREKNGHYLNANNIDAVFIIKTNSNIECKLKAIIRPHGDLIDHHVSFTEGNRFIYDLPSLNVRLKDGHIFGITKFLLLRPETRNNGNEILTTTILEEMSILAPRSAFVNVSYNNELTKLIFQEKIVKEFLENNALIEGPIYEGDERFMFKYPDLVTTGLIKHRMTNGKWTELNNNNFNVASRGLEILNFANHFYSDFRTNAVIDYYSSLNSTFLSDSFKLFPVYDALAFGIGYAHNLGIGNRRFYYDPVTNDFYPIYYDGFTPGQNILIDSKNKIIKRYNLIDIEKYIYFSWGPENHKDFIIPYSARQGSKEAILLLDNLNFDKLHNKLEERGLYLSKDILKIVIKNIRLNLLSLQKIPEERFVKSEPVAVNDLILSKNSIEKLKIKYLFGDYKKNKYKICDLKMKKCNMIELSINDKAKSVEQELKDIEGNDLIFMSNLNEVKENKHMDTSFKNIISTNHNKKITELDKKTKLISFGDIKLQIDSLNKNIIISKYNLLDKLLFKGGNMNDWNIEFMDYSYINAKQNIFPRDSNGLTGCLNFFDVEFKNLKIFVNSAACEDSVNFVRSKGSLNSVKISNTLGDALDADFSNINIFDINIKNSKNDCIDFSYGKYKINKAEIFECGDKGVSAGENSNVFIDNISINKSNIGIASKDFSSVLINKARVINTAVCAAAYSKKQEFSGGFVKIENLNCKKINSFSEIYSLEKGSKIFINKLNDI